MASLEEVFNRIKDSKKEQKDIKLIYKDALSVSKDYQDAVAELTGVRENKKRIEKNIQSQFKSEFEKLESLKLDIQTDMELLGDIALSQLMKGETVEITDEYDNKYQPAFSVKFIKAN